MIKMGNLVSSIWITLQVRYLILRYGKEFLVASVRAANTQRRLERQIGEMATPHAWPRRDGKGNIVLMCDEKGCKEKATYKVTTGFIFRKSVNLCMCHAVGRANGYVLIETIQ